MRLSQRLSAQAKLLHRPAETMLAPLGPHACTALFINHPTISREHAHVIIEDGGTYVCIKDCGSSNKVCEGWALPGWVALMYLPGRPP